jgi:hypothetical protein
MQISKSYAALAATAFAAMLAGCSGSGSQLAPAASQGGTMQSVVRVQNHLVPIDLRGHLGFRGPVLTNNKFVGNVPGGPPWLYLSDVGGNIYTYAEDNPSTFATCAGCGGWGLAVRPGPAAGSRLAAGTGNGTINIYTTTGTPAFKETLTTPSSTPVYGLCFDAKGGLWASGFGTANLYYYSAAKVNGVAGGAQTLTKVMTLGEGENFFLACDAESKLKGKENTLYSYGINGSTGNAEVDQVNTGNGKQTLDNIYGSASSGTGYPGGLSISKTDDLVVYNQYGSLYDMGTVEPWNGALPTPCTVPFSAGNDILDIVWDNTQKEVWGSDYLFTVPATEGISLTPLNGGAACAPGESGGPTAGGGTEYQGVAVSPNTGN